MASKETSVSLGLDAVIVAVTDEVPRVLVVPAPDADESSPDRPALPHGPLDPVGHPTLEKGLREWVAQQSGIHLGYVEQLYTFGDRDRQPGTAARERAVSVAYLALVREMKPPGGRARWQGWYTFLPWEDWRNGRPEILDQRIVPALELWLEDHPDQRDRVDLCFGLHGAPWDPERTLERYELLYQAALIAEAGGATGSDSIGQPMALDHRRILATALGRIRGKIKYRPVVFELLADHFTLLQLQRVVEALAGSRLHKQNFRRLVANQGLVEATGRRDTGTGGRPAELFRFRHEVARERPAPGVGFAGAKWEI